ncbi:hypothetical protein [Bartonella acomydis]|uniref:Uncharacterized protein n=1 Tax=Bartonella acomydis TaxID=686234 RepID=A0ABP9MJD9_9HYPH
MIIPHFIMFSVTYASIQQPTVLPSVVVQESLGKICAIINNNQLLHPSSLFGKAIAKTEQHIQNKHNFDIYWRQIDDGNLKWFLPFFSVVMPPYKSFEVVPTALKHCRKQVVLRYSVKRDVLSLYNTENSKNNFANVEVQKIASRIKVETPVEESQEPVKLKRENPEQIIDLESLPIFLEEDAFTHKASSVHDAFKIEDSSLEKQQE